MQFQLKRLSNSVNVVVHGEGKRQRKTKIFIGTHHKITKQSNRTEQPLPFPPPQFLDALIHAQDDADIQVVNGMIPNYTHEYISRTHPNFYNLGSGITMLLGRLR